MNHLSSYLNDHLSGSVVALEMLAHLETAHTELGTALRQLRDEILADRHGQCPEEHPYHETHGEMQPGACQARPMPAAQGRSQRAESPQRLHPALFNPLPSD